MPVLATFVIHKPREVSSKIGPLLSCCRRGFDPRRPRLERRKPGEILQVFVLQKWGKGNNGEFYCG
jgi:hypothetical protein